jgi:hypothetical protein
MAKLLWIMGVLIPARMQKTIDVFRGPMTTAPENICSDRR